jgi:uncharacterized protein (TIGR01244 family)
MLSTRFVLAILVALLAHGCGSSSTPESTTTPTEAPSDSAITDTSEVKDAEVPTLGLKNAIVYKNALLGGQPTNEQLQAAKDAGFTTIITLRPETEPGFAEEKAQVESLGMQWVSIPMAGKAGLTIENAEALAEAMKGERVLAHCGSGNRVGALIAIKAKLDGQSAEEALATGKAAGLTKLEAAVKEMLEGMP